MKYFDYAASCPLDGEAEKAYLKASAEYYGNASSLHDAGDKARQLLEHCRREFARFFGVSKNGIYFTSGGSEGNFLSIQALLSASPKKGKHIVTGMAEHSSVANTMEKLKQAGYEVTYLPLRPDGRIDPDCFGDALRDDTVVASIQHGNPEIGTIQPIEEIGRLCKEKGILFHSDCVQTFGKSDLTTISPFVDSLTISGHKFYGPKGVGAVYVNPALAWKPFYPGTTHENGFRPGTVNVPGIAAMAVAAKKAIQQMEMRTKHFTHLRQTFMQSLAPAESTFIVYNADLPSTVGMRVKGLEGQFVMLECNRRGFAISTGSACSVNLQTPSKTMTAMGIAGKEAKEFIRISFGRETSGEDVKRLGETLVNIANKKSASALPITGK
ncbi:IscS subfamily cysteine desulfurase [Siminovitchia sp. 179-K 8D1 HS]|uniref:IscS subfamily cysteine desulfurase n=1 Tax=Siminovitchia sp. 179-K 8D1 HS TaxID=3142385 RepID=UPI00399F6458